MDSTKKIFVTTNVFNYLVTLDSHCITITASDRVEYFEWCYVNDKINIEATAQSLSPQIIFEIFDDYQNNKLNNGTNIIFPVDNDSTKPLIIDIVNKVSFYNRTSEIKMTLTLEVVPITSSQRLHRKITNVLGSYHVEKCDKIIAITNQHFLTEHQETINRLQSTINEQATKITHLQAELDKMVEISDILKKYVLDQYHTVKHDILCTKGYYCKYDIPYKYGVGNKYY